MDKETIRKKNQVLKAIMSDPKLSRLYKEAASAPIGSTKREQARSMFSIMKKVGGINDGQGGPMIGAGTPQTYSPTSQMQQLG